MPGLSFIVLELFSFFAIIFGRNRQKSAKNVAALEQRANN